MSLTISSLAETAALIGEPARTAMLFALMDGRALTAGELAKVAGVLPPTASGHLCQLRDAGILAVERQGRHHYYRLASADIAAVLETLAVVTDHRRSGLTHVPVVTGPRDAALRRARVCYDHLAGALGVAIFGALVSRGHVQLATTGAELTETGTELLNAMGIDTAIGVARNTRPQCKPCLDWSERRPHLAGRVGAAICATALERDWIRRSPHSRIVTVTPPGTAALRRHFGISFD